jgi:hypothetical protein
VQVCPFLLERVTKRLSTIPVRRYIGLAPFFRFFKSSDNPTRSIYMVIHGIYGRLKEHYASFKQYGLIYQRQNYGGRQAQRKKVLSFSRRLHLSRARNATRKQFKSTRQWQSAMKILTLVSGTSSSFF